MAKQVERMIGKFESLHQGSKGLFCFDQSSNHAAMPEDALVANRMNLNPGGKGVPLMREGWFMQNDVKVPQSMTNDAGENKGIKAVLIERGLWADHLRLDCIALKYPTLAALGKSSLFSLIFKNNAHFWPISLRKEATLWNSTPSSIVSATQSKGYGATQRGPNATFPLLG